MKTYSELSRLGSYEERLEYLKLDGSVGQDTFGFDRYLNQNLYRSDEWKRTRDVVILRDNGCDLGSPDHENHGQKIIIHHMNPITKEMVLAHDPIIFDPEYLITTFMYTHNVIHFGVKEQVDQTYTERAPNDTCPWKK